MGTATIDSGPAARHPRGLRLLATVVSTIKFIPPLAAIIWLLVVVVTSDPVDCGDDPTCGEGFGLWLFFLLFAGVGLVVGGALFGLQVVAARRPEPIMLFLVAALLLGLDLGLLWYFISDEVGHPAPPGPEFFIAMSFVGAVALGQLTIVAWAAARTFAQRTGSTGSSRSSGSR